MRHLAPLLAALAVATVLSAQSPTPAADTALVRRILAAEEARDASDGALTEGAASRDARVALLARRALARIRDPRFAARDSLDALPAPPAYAEPAWRRRFRALTPRTADCPTLRAALADSAWPVRLHAADLVTPSCAGDGALVTTLRGWLPAATVRTRSKDGAAWQPAAHALVALARVSPAHARTALPGFVRNDAHWVRTYAARAAAVLGDTQALRTMARDRNDNVKEAALNALSTLAGHADDSVFIAALGASGYQAVRAAARALKGATPTRPMRHALVTTAQRLRGDSSETSRDTRTEVVMRLAEMADAQMAGHIATLASDFDCVIAAKAGRSPRRSARQPRRAAPRCRAPSPPTPCGSHSGKTCGCAW